MFTHKWVAGKKISCWQARWNVSSAKFQEKFHLQNTKKCFICKIPRKRRPWNSVTAWAWNIHIWVTDGALRGVNESHCWGNESISESSQTIHQDGVEANYQIHFRIHVRIHSSFWRMRDWQIIEKADWRPLWFIRMKQPAGWQFNSGPPPRLQSGCCWSEDWWQMSSPIEQRDRRDTFSNRRPSI